MTAVAPEPRAVLGVGEARQFIASELPEWVDQIVQPSRTPRPILPRLLRPDFQVDLLRPDDLLSLHIDGYNIRVKLVAGVASLDRVDATKDAFLVVSFPPQNIAEGAFYKGASGSLQLPPAAPGATIPPPDHQPEGKLVAPGNVPARLAGPSRLAFRIAAGSAMPAIAYTVEGLLDWSTWELAVPAIADIGPDPTAAQIAGAPAIAAPATTETALELPYRLILAPQASVGWAHATTPVDHGPGRVELWHTRLALRGGSDLVELWDTAGPAYLRAVWSPDFNLVNPPSKTATDPDLGVTDISPNDRHQIVILTSAFNGWAQGLIPATASGSEKPYVPSPVEARLLMLSSLGGWLRSRGSWDPPHRHRFVGRTFSPLSDLELSAPVRAAPLVPTRGPLLAEHAPPAAAEVASADAVDGIAVDGIAADGIAADGIAADGIAVDGIAAAAVDRTIGIVEQLPTRRPIGHWTDDDQLDLSEWVHVAAQGRDHYVRIVYEGFLYPFGNRAALIKVTERKFIDVTLADGRQTPVAYLIQRQYIVVRQPEMVYPGDPYQHHGREMPIKRIRVTTVVTPDLALPRSILAGTQFSSWIVVDQANPHDFSFHVVATDVAGNETEFTTSLIFYSFSDVPGGLDAVGTSYRMSGQRRACLTSGSKVTYAPRDGATPGTDNTTIATQGLYFDTQANSNPPYLETYGGFVPFLFKADVRLHAVEQLLGTDAPTTIRLYDSYLTHDIDAHAGVFAEIVQEVAGAPVPTLAAAPLPMTFTPKQGGGLATPNMNLASVTRQHGPTAGSPANAAQDAFDAKDFFGSLTGDLIPKLFGSLKLTDILPILSPGTTPSAAKNAPKVNVTTADAATPGDKLVTVAFDWTPDLVALPGDLVSFTPFLSGGRNAALTIHADVTKEVTATGSAVGAGTSHLQGTLTNFTITLLDSVALNVVSFGFSSDSGSKPNVAVQLDANDPFEFTGDLAFVQDLQNIIPAGALGDGPSLDILPTGVKVGFAISLPPADIGVFSLDNIKFAAGLTLPFFSGSPVLDLAFAERANMFTLTVSMFGGGGFFHLQLDTAGIKMLEAAFEFGAAISMDIGVASGGVHVMAGIYFCVQDDPNHPGTNKTTLTGFFRAGGEVSVLGIVSVSIEFELDFTYQSPGKASGEATVSISVHVLFFSMSFSVSVQKQFGGSGNDPTFAQLVESPQIWQDYALAFA